MPTKQEIQKRNYRHQLHTKSASNNEPVEVDTELEDVRSEASRIFYDDQETQSNAMAAVTNFVTARVNSTITFDGQAADTSIMDRATEATILLNELNVLRREDENPSFESISRSAGAIMTNHLNEFGSRESFDPGSLTSLAVLALISSSISEEVGSAKAHMCTEIPPAHTQTETGSAS